MFAKSVRRLSLRTPASCLVAILVLPYGCGQEQAEESAPPLRTVRYATVAVEPGNRPRSFSGVSRSVEQASLGFRVAGVVSMLDVAVGKRVRKGQVMARLDPSGFRLQIQQAEADRLRAEAERRNAAASYERIKGLYENRSASRRELDAARAASESADALVNVAARAVELAELDLSHASLRAPRNCSVAEVRTDVGENVGAGQPVVEVNCGTRLEVAITVPETLIGDIATGMVGEIAFGALPGKTYRGVVSEVGVATGGSAFPVTVLMDPADDVLPGLAARVSLAIAREAPASVLPAAAVAEDGQGRFVYILEDSGEAGVNHARRIPVEVGELTSRGIEVLSGISAGDRIVTAGVSVIRDGMKVKVD